MHDILFIACFVVAMITELIKIVQNIWITEISKTIQASLMKLGMYTGGNVLIMHVIFSPSNKKNCGCYGNGNSQNVAKRMDSKIIQKIFKLVWWNLVCGSVAMY